MLRLRTAILCPAAAALLFLSATPLIAQHAFTETGTGVVRRYDPRVPTPRVLLGYDIGEKFTTHRAMMRYKIGRAHV